MNGRLMGIINFSSPMKFCVIRHFVRTHTTKNNQSVIYLGESFTHNCTESFFDIFQPTHCVVLSTFYILHLYLSPPSPQIAKTYLKYMLNIYSKKSSSIKYFWKSKIYLVIYLIYIYNTNVDGLLEIKTRFIII